MEVIKQKNKFYLTDKVETTFKREGTIKVINEKGQFVRYEYNPPDYREINYNIDRYKKNDLNILSDIRKLPLQIDFRKYTIIGLNHFFEHAHYQSSIRNVVTDIIDTYFPEYQYTWNANWYWKYGIKEDFNIKKDVIIEVSCPYAQTWSIFGVANIRGILTCDKSLDYGEYNNKILNNIFKDKELDINAKIDIMINRLNNYSLIKAFKL